MPPIERSDARACVLDALACVAEFEEDRTDDSTFAQWHEYHKTVFVNAVALNVAKKGSRIALTEALLGSGDIQTVGDFIDYVVENSAYLGEPKASIDAEDPWPTQ